MATRQRKDKKKVQPRVAISSKLRNANAWLNKGCEKKMKTALKKKQKEFRAEGPKLSEKELTDKANAVEAIQRSLNKLLDKQEELLASIRAHYGHTRIEKVQSPLGEMLIAASHKVSIDPKAAKRFLKAMLFQKAGEWRLVPELLIALGRDNPEVQLEIIKAARVTASVSFTPPSSRRPKSGKTSEEE